MRALAGGRADMPSWVKRPMRCFSMRSTWVLLITPCRGKLSSVKKDTVTGMSVVYQWYVGVTGAPERVIQPTCHGVARLAIVCLGRGM